MKGFWGQELFNLLANGQLAVGAFITISGFSLTLPVLRNEFRTRSRYGEFILSRWIRIVPPYLLAILLTISFVACDVALGHTALSLHEVRIIALQILKHIFLLQDIDGAPLLNLPRWSNGVFWTIGVEFKIYLLFPLLLWSIRKGGFVFGAVLTALFSAFLFVLPYQNLTHKATYFVLFFLGIATCAYCRSRTVHRGWLAFATAITLGVLCIHTEPTSPSRMVQVARDLGIGLATCSLMVALSGEPKLRKILETKWLVTIGTYSYSVYLTHVAFIQLALNLNPFALVSVEGQALASVVAVLFALVAARGFFILCERPFFKKRHRVAQQVLSSVAGQK